MANRAYLYASDRLDAWSWEDRGDDYFDSRWNIPLAWFFLFAKEDVLLVDDSGWKEAKLRAERTSAVTRFDQRRGMLDALLRLRLASRYVDEFLERVRGWPGRFVFLDPQEVWAGGLGGHGGEADECHAQQFVKLLEQMDAHQATSALARDLDLYVGPISDSLEKAHLQILGAMY